MERKVLVSILLLLLSSCLFAQHLPVQTDSMRMEKFRTEIGLDMSVPDFEIKMIDANIMGSRLAGIIDYMIDNYNQSVYNRKLCLILKEQVEPLDHVGFELKKLQFVSATKSGNEITLYFTAWLEKNVAKVKQAELVFRFSNGVSDSQLTNELFSRKSRYVQRREALQNQ